MNADLLEVVKRELRINVAVEPGTPLLSSGLINSFQMAHLLTVLEKFFDVTIDASKIGVDNFDTIEQMREYLDSHG